MSEQESKLYALYQAVHLMMARLGADGEIDTRAPEVDAVMDAMHEYDGGQYIQWNAPTHPQPVTPAMVDSLNATVGRMEELNARQDDRERKLALAVTPEGGEVVSDALVYAVLDAFNEAAGDGELFLTSLRDAMRMRLALAEALKAHPPVADAALVRDAERYRFLRNDAYECVVPHGAKVRGHRTGWITHIQPGADFDSAIDLAMQDAALNQRGGG